MIDSRGCALQLIAVLLPLPLKGQDVTPLMGVDCCPRRSSPSLWVPAHCQLALLGQVKGPLLLPSPFPLILPLTRELGYRSAGSQSSGIMRLKV